MLFSLHVRMMGDTAIFNLSTLPQDSISYFCCPAPSHTLVSDATIYGVVCFFLCVWFYLQLGGLTNHIILPLLEP